MSALGGILNFDDRPMDNALFAALVRSLAARGPDGGSEVCYRSIGMGYRAFHTNLESQLETQPFVSKHGQILAWDGRLDNREDLISQLGDSLCVDRHTITDVEIAMAAYLRWGASFLSRIIGDFALSLWDPRSAALLLARDAFGSRSLSYRLTGDRIVWASGVESLLDLDEIEVEINDDYIAGFLTRLPEPWLTPYRGIQALPPASVLVVADGQARVKRFWELKSTRQMLYSRDSDYEEHFLELFRDSIRNRLRVSTPVIALLSGGLDSSSVVCVADEIIRNRETQVPALNTVSYVYDQARTSDERKFIRCVEAKRGRTGYHIVEDENQYLSSPMDDFIVTAPTTLLCFDKRQRRLHEALKDSGARVVFKGVGGDEMLISNEDPDIEMADLIAQRELHLLHRRLLIWSQALKKPYTKLLWASALLLLPQRVQASLSPQAKLPAWFDHEFVSRMNLRERMLVVSGSSGDDLPSQRDMEKGLSTVVQAIAAANLQEWGCVEYSYPFLHRPLVEFLQATPIEQKVRPGESRSLMRRALRNLLPEEITKRRGKQGPDEAISRALVAAWPRLRAMFLNSRVAARGYVNSDELLVSLDRARHGAERNTYALLKTISLEFWLRSLEQRRVLATKRFPIDNETVEVRTAHA